MNQKHIIIVDDHQVVLKGMSQIVLDVLGPDTVIHTAPTGATLLEFLRTVDFDVCILDMELPDMDGLELLTLLRRQYTSLKIIVHTIHEQVWFMKEFLKFGVEGILFKDCHISEISGALTTVLAGGRYYSRTARILKNAVENHTLPTQRELDVLKLLAAGETTETISRQLDISINTTESHRRHLLEKFNARNVAELVLKAVAEGFLPVNKNR